MTTERERRERARREFMREEAKRTTGVLLAVSYFCLFRALFVRVLVPPRIPRRGDRGRACAPDLLVVSAPETTAPDYAARFVDISAPIKQGAQTDPPICAPNVSYTNHSSPAPPELAALFPGLRLEDLPNGDLWALERVEMCTHSGAHVDAPWHYSATMADGSKPMTIREVPLDWFHGRGVKLDFRDVPDGHVVTAAEIRAKLREVGHVLSPGDVVLMNTAAGAARVPRITFTRGAALAGTPRSFSPAKA